MSLHQLDRETDGLPAGRRSVPALAGALLPVVLAFMSACGDNGNGEEDTLLTGLSGVVIFALVVWLVIRTVRQRRS